MQRWLVFAGIQFHPELTRNLGVVCSQNWLPHGAQLTQYRRVALLEGLHCIQEMQIDHVRQLKLSIGHSIPEATMFPQHPMDQACVCYLNSRVASNSCFVDFSFRVELGGYEVYMSLTCLPRPLVREIRRARQRLEKYKFFAPMSTGCFWRTRNELVEVTAMCSRSPPTVFLEVLACV